MAAHLAQIARVNPPVNAIVAKLPDEACLALADEADRRQASGAPLGAAARPADRLQGPAGRQGLRLQRAARASTRDHVSTTDAVLVERLRHAGALGIGKTNVPGVRSRLAHLQRGLRHHAEPLRPHQERRRIERRRRRGAGRGHAAHRRRQRPRRLAAQPRQLQQRGRAAAIGRPRADRPRSVSAARLRRERADGPLGGRRRLPARRDGGSRSARPRLRAVGSRAPARRPRARPARIARGLGARSRWAAARRARAGRARRAARHVRVLGLRRRRRLPGPTAADDIFLTIRRWRTAARVRTAALRNSAR